MALVGRERELREIRAGLEAQPGLLTLTGLAGAGKSAVARAVAAGGDGILCDVFTARDEDDLIRLVAEAMAMPAAAGVADALAAAPQRVLILDNVDQRAVAAGAIRRWQDAAPELRILATSRAPLGVPRERSCVVGPLAPRPALELFLARAEQALPGISRDEEARSAAVELVDYLDRLPLTIALAAARVGVLGVSASAHDRDALEGIIAEAWARLAPAGRDTLCALSVFCGRFRAADACAIVAIDDEEELLARLDELRRLGLLIAHAGDEGSRLELLPSVRELAAARSEQRGVAHATAGRHVEWALAAGEAAAGHPCDATSDAAQARLDELLPNLRAALEHALDEGAPDGATAVRLTLVLDECLRLSGPVGPLLRAFESTRDYPAARRSAAFSLAFGRLLRTLARGEESRAHLERAIAVAGDPAVAEFARVQLGFLRHTAGDLAGARQAYLAAAGSRHPRVRAFARGLLANVAREESDLEAALPRFADAIALFESIGDVRGEGIARGHLADVLHEAGRVEDADREYRRAIELLPRRRDRQYRALFTGARAHLALDDGDVESALAAYAEACAELSAIGDRRGRARMLAGYAMACAAAGDRERALRRCDDAEQALLAQDAALDVVALARAHVDLATTPRAAGVLERARQRAERGLTSRSVDERRAARTLIRLSDNASAERGLCVYRDGSAAITPDGSRVDLTRHEKRRLLLFALVDRRLTAPADPVSIAELTAAGWPDEKILLEAARNRVYAALSGLRRAGLAGLLKRSGAGYYLDPSVPVVWLD